jgi:hypothetical protein
MDVKLSKALTVGDKTYESLPLDLEKLTGADVDFCAREAAAAKGALVLQLILDHEFHIQLAAKASGIEAAALKKLSARDYVGVATTVQAFLTGSI